MKILIPNGLETVNISLITCQFSMSILEKKYAIIIENKFNPFYLILQYIHYISNFFLFPNDNR